MHNGKLSFILSLLISGFCAYLLAHLTWQVHGIFNPRASYVASTPYPGTLDSTPANTRPIEDFVSEIIKHNIFGRMPINTSNTLLKAEPKLIKKTHLKIDLLGLIKGNQSAAVIRFEEKQEVYRVGDFVQETANNVIKVTAIEEDHVIILNNGVPERLLLPLKNNGETGVARVTTSTRNSINLSEENIKAFMGDDVRDTLMVDPFSYSTFVTFSPFLQGNTLHGYRITPGQDKRLLQELGLSSSDVITRINSIPIYNLNASMFSEILQSIDPIEITLERNGQTVNMDILF